MSIQLNAASRLNAAKADDEAAMTYLKSLGIKGVLTPVASEHGYISFSANKASYDAAVTALQKHFGEPKKMASGVVWNIGQRRVIQISKSAKGYTISLIDNKAAPNRRARELT